MEHDNVKLIDVRDYNEWIYCRIEGAELIPLPKIYDTNIPRDDQSIVVYCHTGQRSHHAAQVLLQRGFTDVYNLEGGIDAYARTVNPDIPRY